jgi:hypothetical protein
MRLNEIKAPRALIATVISIMRDATTFVTSTGDYQEIWGASPDVIWYKDSNGEFHGSIELQVQTAAVEPLEEAEIDLLMRRLDNHMCRLVARSSFPEMEVEVGRVQRPRGLDSNNITYELTLPRGTTPEQFRALEAAARTWKST